MSSPDFQLARTGWTDSKWCCKHSSCCLLYHQQPNSCGLWCFSYTQLLLKGPKALYTTISRVNHWQTARWINIFHIYHIKFSPYYLNVAAETITHPAREHFSNLLLFGVSEPVLMLASIYSSYRTWYRQYLLYGSMCHRMSGWPMIIVSWSRLCGRVREGVGCSLEILKPNLKV